MDFPRTHTYTYVQIHAHLHVPHVLTTSTTEELELLFSGESHRNIKTIHIQYARITMSITLVLVYPVPVD